MHLFFLFGAVRPLPYFFIVTTILGVLFTFISPDSGRAPFSDLVFWLSQTLIPLSSILFTHLILSKLQGFNKIGSIAKLAISGLTGILIYLPIALWIDMQFDDQSLPSAYSALVFSALEELIAVGPPILIGWVAMNLPWLLGYQFERVNSPDIKPPSSLNSDQKVKNTPWQPAGESILPSFFPKDLNTLVLLKAELHYLLVVTPDNKDLHLYNLRDAINLLGQLEGISPHRSWWVNRRYIDSFTVRGRQGKLVLKNGVEIPVSRRKISEVRETVNRWGITIRA